MQAAYSRIASVDPSLDQDAMIADVLGEFVIDGYAAVSVSCGVMDDLLTLPVVPANASLIGLDPADPMRAPGLLLINGGGWANYRSVETTTQQL